MKSVITVVELEELRQEWRKQGYRLAFVPTMGALHDGHFALVKRAKELCDRVLVSIFVNPTQFGPNEDFHSYPRTLEQDLEALAALEVDGVFLPNAGEIYPEGFQTYVHNEVGANIMCGKSRPGHFRGVLTVVMKLFNLVKPDVAIFGEKDYQQLSLIQMMVRDLCVPVEVVGHPTLREKDGLALSSRNRRLDETSRSLAPHLHKGLLLVQKKLQEGERDVVKLVQLFCDHLAQVPEFELDYFEIRKQNLEVFSGKVEGKAVMLVAAKLGGVRLIDNLQADAPL